MNEPVLPLKLIRSTHFVRGLYNVQHHLSISPFSVIVVCRSLSSVWFSVSTRRKETQQAKKKDSSSLLTLAR